MDSISAHDDEYSTSSQYTGHVSRIQTEVLCLDLKRSGLGQHLRRWSILRDASNEEHDMLFFQTNIKQLYLTKHPNMHIPSS